MTVSSEYYRRLHAREVRRATVRAQAGWENTNADGWVKQTRQLIFVGIMATRRVHPASAMPEE